jgi:SPP1 gp7 family putative phage head morphogenesis protein
MDEQFWADEARRLLAVLQPPLTEAAQTGARLAMGFNSELANEAAAQWAAQYTDDLLAQLNTTTKKMVGGAINEWIQRPGATIGELQRTIGDGLAVSQARASAIAVTETTRAFAEGNKIGYQAAGIKRIRWQTNNDELVCPVCGPLNQQVKPIGEAFGEFNGRQIDAPPAHPNCRCWITPVADDV